VGQTRQQNVQSSGKGHKESRQEELLRKRPWGGWGTFLSRLANVVSNTLGSDEGRGYKNGKSAQRESGDAISTDSDKKGKKGLTGNWSKKGGRQKKNILKVWGGGNFNDGKGTGGEKFCDVISKRVSVSHALIRTRKIAQKTLEPKKFSTVRK